MRVLHVYRTYFPDPPGGLQEAIRQICLSTQPYGIDNTIFTLSPQPRPSIIRFPETTVVRCRSWAAPASCDLGSLRALQQFRALTLEADVIHYFFPWPFGDLLRLVAPRKPAVLTYISDIVRQRWLGALYSPLMWHTLRSMNAIVANAPNYAKNSPILSDPSLSRKTHQIPLGIVESSQAITPENAILSRLGLSGHEPFLLFIGVLRYYKGLHVLLDAAQRLSGKVVIAGSGPEESRLRAKAKQLNLGNVIFAGQVSDAEKIALLKACRGLVLPSHLRSEAYGMVLVEASLQGKPMITCEIGTGTSFVNQHQVTGFVVAPESPQALSAAMTHLLSDAALADQLGRAARQRYEALFSATAMGTAYADLFRAVIQPTFHSSPFST